MSVCLLNNKHTDIEQRLRQYQPSEIALCSIVKAEFLYGVRHSQQVEAKLQLLKQFFASLVSLPFDGRYAEESWPYSC